LQQLLDNIQHRWCRQHQGHLRFQQEQRDREELQELLKVTEQRFSDTQPDCPEHWGGYRLLPERIEFWQGRASRLHDRLNYRLQDTQWIRERLAP
jgi:pyridoxamine 5'-phosphate oxidase